MDHDDNPYRPPAEGADAGAPVSESGDDYELASNSRRLANLFLDYLGVLLFSLALGVILELAGLGETLAPLVDSQLFGIGVVAFYYIAFESTLGRTPGKMLTGCTVIDVAGGPPRFMQILGRTASRFVPFEPFSFLGQRPGWHDRWSATRVVRTNSLKRG